MAWEDVQPNKKSKGTAIHAVTVRITEFKNGYRRLIVTARPGMTVGLAWWAPDQAVRAQIGTEDDAGRIRISTGGPLRLVRTGPPIQDRCPSLTMPLPSFVPRGTTGHVGVDFVTSDGAMVIELPSSWINTQTAAAPARTIVPEPVATPAAPTRNLEIAVDPWMVRTKPGVAQAPVPLPFAEIARLARSEGHDVGRMEDLPAFNRSRITKGLPPLVVRKS